MATSGFIGAPEPFDERTEDWTLYTQRFEHFLLANSVNEDEKKRHLLLAMIGGRTFKLLANLVAPKKPGEVEYAAIHKVLQDHFKPKPIKIAERYRFYKRNQQPSETVTTYLAELRRLASTCEFGEFLNEALCDRLVCGLREESMQRRLLAEPRLDLKRACELAQGMEAALKDAKEIQSTDADSGSTNRVGHAKSGSAIPCSRCNGFGHKPTECRYKSTKCNKCHRTGHLAKACRSKSLARAPSTPNAQGQTRRNQPSTDRPVHHIDSNDTGKEQSPADIVHVHSVTPSLPESYKVPVEINGTSLLMELDTGAAVSLISKATWSQQLNSPDLQASDLKLQSYPNRNLPVLGCCTVTARVQNADQVHLPLIVVEGQGPSLFGGNWLEKVNLDWRELAKVNSVTTPKKRMGEQLNKLIQQYKDVITDKLGHCRKVKAKLYMKEDAIPRFHRPRPLPLALKAKVEKELECQVKLGIIQKVDVSEWGTPIVPVVKPSGALRLCGDYKTTVNSQLQVYQYPLPRPEELFAALNGGQKFTTLDLSEAFLQIELEEKAKAYTTINTHKGLYSFNRLPNGIASSPAIFQCLIEQILPKLPGVVCYIDDILITGKDDDEHFSHLEAVLQSFKEYGLTIKISKCQTLSRILGKSHKQRWHTSL